MIGPEASAFGIRLQLQLEIRHQQHLLEQIVEAELLLGRDLRELGRSSPLLGLQALGGEIGLDALDVGVGQIDLVDGDDDRHSGGAGVRDRLLGLRHDAVVGGHHEHGDVGDLGAAGAHGGEGLVAGRVDEGDPPGAVLDLVGADVLGDAADLAGRDRGLADGIEKRRLAVVDVAHDRDHRRARLEILGRVLDSSELRLPSSSAACLILISRGGSSSAPISSTASSVSDWVMVTISPIPIMILMIWATGIPSACERSLTLTPEGTVTGPVGAAGALSRGRASARGIRRVPGAPGLPPPAREAWLSITTRRLRRPPTAPWRGRIGRFGREEPELAIGVSVEVAQRRIDSDLGSRTAIEAAQRGARSKQESRRQV